MPKGIYERTPEQMIKLKEQAKNINLGKKFSEEHRKKLTEARKKRTDSPWNKGKKIGPLSKEHREKIGTALIGHAVSEKTRDANLKRCTKHNHANRGKQSSTYICWAAMIRRCFNKNTKDYPGYGGRGITVTERWLNFENFLADMGEKPKGLSIDRINNDGNYEPGNCRWATPKEQAQNRRKTKIA